MAMPPKAPVPVSSASPAPATHAVAASVPAPVAAAPAPATATATATTAASSTPPLFTAAIIKGEHGIGLDIWRTTDNGCVVQRLKDMPPGVPNPAAKCVPPIKTGDLIIGVNGTKMVAFNDIVKAIRASGADVKLLISRPQS
jgi:C-terminal processing protease CtpA/Prc